MTRETTEIYGHAKFQLPLTIRRCAREDLENLEWLGLLQHHREVIQSAYRRQKRGEVLLLLAVSDANGLPVGQVWIDLLRKREESVGYLWAVRVVPWLRKHGIGARLIETAEDILSERGFRHAELTVERTNRAAVRFYERIGYRKEGALEEEYEYRTPEGEHHRIYLDELIYRKELDPSRRARRERREAGRKSDKKDGARARRPGRSR